MIKLATNIFLIAFGVSFLAGCATQEQNIKLTDNFWQEANHKIIVAKIKPDNKPELKKTGDQGGLLFIAANALATRSFNNYLEKFSLEWYEKLPSKFSEQIKQRNILTQTHPVDIEIKQRKKADFTIQTDSNKILLLELQNLGATRHYEGFPKHDPIAYCTLKGELIDKKNNKVIWRYTITTQNIVHGEWDQPPSYPNFTKSLEKAIASAQEEIIDDFFAGH